MARIERVDALLREWAQWRMVGDGSGYPRTSMLHPEWSPPAKGRAPGVKVGMVQRGPMVEGLVRQLSVTLQDTLFLVYVVTGVTNAERAERLRCRPETIPQRVRQAHALLAGLLDGDRSGLTEKCNGRYIPHTASDTAHV